MPEQLTVELSPPPAGEVSDEPREFGTSLEDIFAKSMPGGLTIEEEEKVTEGKGKEKEKGTVREEPKKKQDEPEKKEKPKSKKEESPKPLGITDILQSSPEKVDKVGDGTGASTTDDGADIKKVEVPAEFKGKTREHFEKLASEKWEADKRAAALEKKYKDAESKIGKGNTELETKVQQLEAVVKDYSTRLERAGLEHHPWYEANFVAPRKQLLESAERAVKDAGVDPKLFQAAMRLDGQAKAEKLDEIYADISSTTQRGKIERAIDAIESLDARRDQVLANREATIKGLSQMDQENQKKMLANHAAQTKASLSEAKELLRDKFGFFVFKTVDDPKYDWWNDEVKKMDGEAENLMLKTTDPKELTVGSYLAVAAPRIMNLLTKEIGLRKAAEKELSDYKNSEPKLGGGSRKSRAEESEEEGEEKPLVNRILDHIHENS